jgi:hypothetical protein
MTRLICLSAIIFLAISHSVSAQVLCARPETDGSFNSTLRLRSICRSAEREVPPIALGVSNPIVVRDTNGLVVGAVISITPSNPRVSIVRVLDDTALALEVTRDGFVSSNPVFFEASDCTGTAFTTAEANDTLMFVRGEAIGSTAYYPTGTPSDRTIGSRLFQTITSECLGASGTVSDGGSVSGQPLCCVTDGRILSVSPVTIFDLSTLSLQPPFHVE